MAGPVALATVGAWPSRSVRLAAHARRTRPNEAMERHERNLRLSHILAYRGLIGPLFDSRDASMRTTHAPCTETTLR